ncbi:aromatic ring-hydroxylating dioxygenase subunit alpha [Acidaminobacter sp. JC074]|uniref:aromatic ring-hydroxylating oxygenase subunit alpha n=1 Tax=Acidaminobacter sp. JC074 TaxID=2530199 RepID=UPI001F0F65AE|nr:aromatic ring-hydroxylating dioxygenase subunit alpha [Acidaminobacter sp. JC074]MCH4887992.1 aromatic ring-hydroxylating dioxygenase subunit alpha [Acidaminobacter sp. JC074]
MIKNQWYVVLGSNEVKRKPVGVTRLNEKLVFYRDTKGKVHCLKDRCVHRGVSLSLGEVCGDDLICPFHGFEYDHTGKVKVIPAYGRNYQVPDRYKVVSYETYESHGYIFIYYGSRPDSEPSYFTDLEGFTYSEMSEVWSVHYSRAIENQLDVVHVPFVHHNTIGKGKKYVVDGPLIQWLDEEKFEFYVYNRIEDGTIAKKPSDMRPPDPEKDFRLAFKFPNLWQNYIDDKIRITAAFVPIDEDHTKIYLRFYQCFLKVPLLSVLVNELAMIFNRKVLHQDRRVVLSQVPKKSMLKMSDILIQGDLPILTYRKRRDQLLKLGENHEIQ